MVVSYSRIHIRQMQVNAAAKLIDIGRKVSEDWLL